MKIRAWFGAVAAVAALGALGALPATSRAALSWSAAVSVNDGQPDPMYSVACPTASQCTAVDFSGLQVTFDPGSPQAWSSYAVQAFQEDSAIACPTVSQCTSVGAGGREVTFDPDVAGGSMPDVIDGPRQLEAVACPSVSQCTAVDEDGRALNFDPAHPSATVAVSLSSAPLSAIACPTATQCTAVDPVQSRLVTFDPEAPGSTQAITLAAPQDSLACPSASECVAIGGPQQQSVEFNPQTGQTQAPITRSQSPLFSVACPSVSQCTATADSGEEVTFDPGSTAIVSRSPVDTVGECCTNNALGHIACPTTTRCVAVAQTWGGDEWTFDPRAPGHPPTEPVGDAAPLIAVACPLPTECTTLAKVEAPFLPSGYNTTYAMFAPDPQTKPSGEFWLPAHRPASPARRRASAR